MDVDLTFFVEGHGCQMDVVKTTWCAYLDNLKYK